MKNDTAAVLAIAVFASSIAFAATEDPSKRDLEQGRRHRAALAEKEKDIDALKAEVSRLRATAEMCRDREQAASAPRREGGRLDE